MKSTRSGQRALTVAAWATGFAVFVLFLATTIRDHANATGTANPRVFLERLPLNTVSGAGDTVRTARAQFRARHAGFGTVVLPMGTCESDLAAGVRIRVRETGAQPWLLDERHQTDSWGCGPLRAFEFPIITDSRRRSYDVEVTGGSSTEVLLRYHVLAALPSGDPLPRLRFLVARAWQFLQLPTAVELVTIVLLSVGAAFAVGCRATTPAYEPILAPSRRIGAAVFLFTLVTAGAFGLLGVDPHHDGILFKPAMDVRGGQMLFRDTFSQYGALTTLLQAGALAVFGPTLLVLRLLTALAYAGTAVLMHAVLRRLVPGAVALTLLAIWMFGAPYFAVISKPWSSVYALFFQLLAFWLLLERRDIPAGLAASLAFWCRQPVGMFLAVAVLCAWIWMRVLGQITTRELGSRSFRFLTGFLLACVPFLIWLAANGAVLDWWNQCFRLTARWAIAAGGESTLRQLAGVVTNLFPAAGLHLQPTAVGVLSWWPLLPLATLIVLVRNSLSRPSPTIILSCFIGLASWLQYHPVPDILHMYWSAGPMYGIMGVLLLQLTARVRANLQVASVVAALLSLAVPETAYRLAQGISRWQTNDQTLSTPRVLTGLRLSAKEAEFHRRFTTTLERLVVEDPSANIITTGPDALFLTYSTRARNIGKMYVNWLTYSEIVTPRYRERLLAYVAEEEPIVITGHRNLLIPPGYCRVPGWRATDAAFLYTPCR